MDKSEAEQNMRENDQAMMRKVYVDFAHRLLLFDTPTHSVGNDRLLSAPQDQFGETRHRTPEAMDIGIFGLRQAMGVVVPRCHGSSAQRQASTVLAHALLARASCVRFAGIPSTVTRVTKTCPILSAPGPAHLTLC